MFFHMISFTHNILHATGLTSTHALPFNNLCLLSLSYMFKFYYE